MLLILKFQSPVTHKTAENTVFIVCGDVQNGSLQGKKEVFICQIILLSGNFRQQHLQSGSSTKCCPSGSWHLLGKNISSDDLEVLIFHLLIAFLFCRLNTQMTGRESKWSLGSPMAGENQGKLLDSIPKLYSPNSVTTWAKFIKCLFARNKWFGGISCGFSARFFLEIWFPKHELVSFSSCHNHTFMFLMEHTRRKAGKTDKLCKL